MVKSAASEFLAFAMKDVLPKTSVVASLVADAAAAAPQPIEQEVMHLFDELRKPLLRYLSSFALETADAEEVVQETFLALFQHLQRGKDRHNLKGWLFRVAHNLALRMRRDDLRERPAPGHPTIEPAEMLIDPDLDPEGQFAARQTREVILSIIDALPEQDRRCLYLRAEGLRYRDIAEILDISISTVSASLGRSLTRIGRVTEW